MKVTTCWAKRKVSGLRGWFLQHTQYNLAQSAHALGLDDVQAPLLCRECALNLEGDNDAFDCDTEKNENVRRAREAECAKLALFETLAVNRLDLIFIRGLEVGSSRWGVVGGFNSKPHRRVLGLSACETSPEQAIIDAIAKATIDPHAYIYAYGSS